MKYLFDNLSEIEKKLRSIRGILLMFDFDGTLSPLASTPQQAKFPNNIKNLISKCSKFFPVVIISGRSLKDIKIKVGLKNLIYAGNHGLEWQIGNKKDYFVVTKEAFQSYLVIKNEFKKIKRFFPGILIEDKKLTLAIHYRKLDQKFVVKFKKKAESIIKLFNKINNLQVLRDKKTIEFRPNFDWNKGKFALYIFQYFENKFKHKILPIYFGDSATDEDVFKILPSGLTIKVGYSKISQAIYYLNNPSQVALFMQWLLLKTAKDK